jgi:uncharacterized protein (TIGR02996 family)
MPDRESFVAAIAAAPDDDLPRLVFADWLDEHGEPDRAEFIRLQIQSHNATDPAERRALDERVSELYRDHWPTWFGPFLRALDPDRPVPGGYNPSGGPLASITARSPDPLPGVQCPAIRRGFLDHLTLTARHLPPECSLGAALWHEPVHHIVVRLDRDPHAWAKLTDPALRRVSELYLWEDSGTDGGPLTAVLPAFADPHLAGVRSLGLYTQRALGWGAPLHARTAEAFAGSPLAYRLNELTVRQIGDGGVRELCRKDRLHLDRLTLGGELTAVGVRQLGAAPFAPGLQSLCLDYAGLDDEAVAGFRSRSGWRSLTELDLSHNRITDAGLRSLAAAEFTPHLEVLNLSRNDLYEELDENTDGLRELAAALNPGCLRLLNLTGTGLSGVPDFLATTFGDRVTVGW